MVEKQERPVGKTEMITIAGVILAMLIIIGVTAFIRVLPARAQSTPEYGKYPVFVFTSSVSTDEALVTAPGSGYRYVVTDVNYAVRVAGEDDYVALCSYTGTSVGDEFFEVPLDTEGFSQYHHFNPGIPLPANYGIWSDYVGGDSGVAFMVINGYVEGAP